MDSIVIGLGFLCILTLGYLKLNKINNRIEYLEKVSKVLISDLSDNVSFVIYQGDGRMLTVEGVAANGNSFVVSDYALAGVENFLASTYHSLNDKAVIILGKDGEIEEYKGIILIKKDIKWSDEVLDVNEK